MWIVDPKCARPKSAPDDCKCLLQSEKHTQNNSQTHPLYANEPSLAKSKSPSGKEAAGGQTVIVWALPTSLRFYLRIPKYSQCQSGYLCSTVGHSALIRTLCLWRGPNITLWLMLSIRRMSSAYTTNQVWAVDVSALFGKVKKFDLCPHYTWEQRGADCCCQCHICDLSYINFAFDNSGRSGRNKNNE